MRFVLIFVIALILASCQQPFNVSNESSSSLAVKETGKQLPTLQLIIDGNRISTARGAYSWSYKEGNSIVHEMTDIDIPPRIINGAEPIKVDDNTQLELLFSIEPSRIEWKLWNEQQAIITYEKFQAIQQTGKYVVEIIAHYDDTNSRVSFIKAVDFQ